jgi:signal transduction histidine kinase
VLLPDGKTRWLSTWAQVQRGAPGGTLMVGATLSIDAYKNAEAALREADRRKDEFLAMLAHELRNPLAPIGSAAQLLRMGIDDPQKVRRASEVIHRQVAHITKLVDDLLDVSRVTRGIVRLERAAVDLREVLDAAVEQVQSLIDARGHHLQRAVAGEVRVTGDRARLVQVVANLLNNAARYTPPGGHIQLTLAAEGEWAVIRVADDGRGIEPEVLPRLFELFSQGSPPPGEAASGLGIGLALTRRLAQLHGGSATAESAGHGRGSTFTVKLPMPREERWHNKA